MTEREQLIQKHPFIYAWGIQLGSYEGYILGEIRQAIKDGAPYDAIFKDHDGSTNDPDQKIENGWHTFRGILSLDAKISIQKFLKEKLNVEIPKPSYKDTFKPVGVHVGNRNYIEVKGLNENNPNDVDRVTQALRYFFDHWDPSSGSK